MMGLSNAVFWLSWAITYSIQFLISCIIVTLILYKGFFAYVSFAVSFFIFILFSLSTVSLAIVRILFSCFLDLNSILV
jgi:ATP-binding cassette subfamily A (ABC1) protein 3